MNTSKIIDSVICSMDSQGKVTLQVPSHFNQLSLIEWKQRNKAEYKAFKGSFVSVKPKKKRRGLFSGAMVLTIAFTPNNRISKLLLSKGFATTIGKGVIYHKPDFVVYEHVHDAGVNYYSVIRKGLIYLMDCKDEEVAFRMVSVLLND